MTTLTKRNSLLPTWVNEMLEADTLPIPVPSLFNGDVRSMLSRMSFPAANITENGKSYTISLAVPGLDKKDFKIELENETLTVSAEKEESKSEQTDTYNRREYSYNNFSRSFYLPETVERDKVEARYENGVLRLTLPKTKTAAIAPKREVKIL